MIETVIKRVFFRRVRSPRRAIETSNIFKKMLKLKAKLHQEQKKKMEQTEANKSQQMDDGFKYLEEFGEEYDEDEEYFDDEEYFEDEENFENAEYIGSSDSDEEDDSDDSSMDDSDEDDTNMTAREEYYRINRRNMMEEKSAGLTPKQVEALDLEQYMTNNRSRQGGANEEQNTEGIDDKVLRRLMAENEENEMEKYQRYENALGGLTQEEINNLTEEEMAQLMEHNDSDSDEEGGSPRPTVSPPRRHIHNQRGECLTGQCDGSDEEDVFSGNHNNSTLLESSLEEERMTRSRGRRAGAQELFGHIKNYDLRLVSRPPTANDGNCWYDAIADQIVVHDLPNLPRDQASLRRAVVAAIPTLPQVGLLLLTSVHSP